MFSPEHQNNMKPYSKKTIFALIMSLLVTSSSLLAQVAPPSPASVAPNYNAGNETSIIMPKARSNLFLDVGFQYLKTDLKTSFGDTRNYNFYGINLAFGWRINANNKIQIDIAGLGSYKDYGNGNEETLAAVPELFTYSYCIPLGSNGRWELRLSPSIGFSYIFARDDYSGYYGSGWQTDSDISFAYGAGVGVTCHVSKRVYLDLSYRYLRVTGPSLFDRNYEDMDTSAFTLACGWKF